MFCHHKFDSIAFNNSHLYTVSVFRFTMTPDAFVLVWLNCTATYLLHIRQRRARLGDTPAGWSYEEEAARLNAVTLRLTPATESHSPKGWRSRTAAFSSTSTCSSSLIHSRRLSWRDNMCRYQRHRCEMRYKLLNYFIFKVITVLK